MRRAAVLRVLGGGLGTALAIAIGLLIAASCRGDPAPAPAVVEAPPCVDPIHIWSVAREDVITDGLYFFQDGDGPRIVFDVPAEVVLRVGDLVINEHGPDDDAGYGILLDRVDGPGGLGFHATTGEFYRQWAPPDDPVFAAGLATLVASVRLDDGSDCP